MRIKSFAATSALALIAGCTGLSERIDRNVDQADSKASMLVKDVGHAAAAGVVGNVMPSAQHESGIWLGKNVVKVGQPSLPPIFNEAATFDRTVSSLSELAERLTLRTGIPTKVSHDASAVSSGSTQATAGNGAILPPGAISTAPLPAGLQNAARMQGPVRITYASGSLKGLLDTAAARFGVYWKYANNTIQFYYTDSRTFQIAALPGDSTFSATVTSGASSSGGVSAGGNGSGGNGTGGVTANNTQNTGVASQLSVYSSIEKAILAMLSSRGKVVASPSTGTITVVDTPDTLDRVAEFIEAENKSLSRQIAINVTVLSVTLNKSDNYGINWQLVYKGLSSAYGITNTATSIPNSTSISAGILSSSNSKFASSNLLAQALSTQGKVRQETSASVVTLNNQPVPVQVATQTSYLQSLQTTSTAQVGSTTSMVPGVVTSGFNMSILPHVLNNGTVLLQFSTDISALSGIRTVSSGAQNADGTCLAKSSCSSIEVPTINTRNFLQRVSMKSNETLIISGFEQADDRLHRNGVGTPDNYVLGGGFAGSDEKQVIVILITPTTSDS
ncbi:PilN family type IVB pilus formation outer membrane protein [Collimonas humicola]|uniref:PilN family type IVB pilus formation outer membrane protein n=1 Tax=Collimonas humicola TaxID=2825886 RepID=UPI001B8B184E|nr:PilN family type IVB pilus formation outer membrane protein [Collimonas humicola]